jgi:hypothetical protein
MIIKNEIDKPFGPAGAWTGVFLLVAGIGMSFISLFYLGLVIVGAFIGFTYESTYIDMDKKRVKSVHHLFGIIPYGTWIPIDPGMKLGIKRIHRGYSTSTRGNTLEVHMVDFRIILYSKFNRPVIHLKKYDSVEEAEEDIQYLGSHFAIPVKR